MVKGIQFLVDERGKKTAVVIDLRKNAELWEDFHLADLVRSETHSGIVRTENRKHGPRI